MKNKNKNKNKTRKINKLITATIDLNAIQHNLTFIRKKSKAEVMVVLKANAYGLGMIEIAKFCRKLNVHYLGVATIDEAIQLRKSGDNGKIVAWLYDIHNDQMKDAIMNRIELAIFDETHIPLLASIIPESICANVHLFVDTGINRNGITYAKAIESAIQIDNNPKFNLVGVMSHLCCTFMKSKKYTQEQYTKFKQLRIELEHHNIKPEWFHLSNSGGVLNYSNTEFNMVRCGQSIYGFVKNKNILPVLSLTTKIIQIKRVNKGEGIGYDRMFIVNSDMIIAIVPIGYADMIPYKSGKLCVYVNGPRRHVLGLISMDQMVIESNAEDKLGDEVELFGKHQTIYDFINRDIDIVNMTSHMGNRIYRNYRFT